MTRFYTNRILFTLALCMSIFTLTNSFLAAAQVRPAPPAKKAPAAPVPARPVRQAAPVKPAQPAAPPKPAPAPVGQVKPTATPVRPVATVPVVAKSPTSPAQPATLPTRGAKTQTPVGAVAPVSSQASLPARPVTPGATTPRAMPASTAYGQSSPGAVAGDPRSAVATQGLGTFLGGGWTVTAYGCFRSNTRVLCDFDVLPPHNTQIGAGAFMPWVHLVDDGGKITSPHNAFFQATDGSQLTVAYADVSNPLRLLMEYDDVAPNFNSVALVHGADRIQGVPITPADPDLPAGAIQARGAAPATQAPTAQAPAAGTDPTGTVDQAAGTVTNASQKIHDKKTKAISTWQQMKDAANAIKH